MPKAIKHGDPTRAIAYVRVSTEDQRNGPEVQRKDIERWATRERIDIVAWHIDQGVSGGNEIDDRPELTRALAALRPHNAGILVVQKRDRLARDVVIAVTIERVALRDGARVISASGEGNGDDPTARLQRGIVDLFAEYERALIRARTKAALQSKKARGEVAGHPAFGLRRVEGVRAEVNDSEREVHAKIKDLRAMGLSLRQIVVALDRDGVRGRAGKPLQLTQVARLVSRAELAGGTTNS